MLLLAFSVSTTYAQEASTASGGDASGSGGTVAYSVGQVVYTANTGTGGSVSQGIQQPYEISVISIKETKADILLNIFPNPATGILTLQTGAFEQGKLTYLLFDVEGKLIDSKGIKTDHTQINMSSLQPATYVIEVKQENKTVQSFKIIKN